MRTLALALVGSLAAPALAQPRYTLTVIPTPDPTWVSRVSADGTLTGHTQSNGLANAHVIQNGIYNPIPGLAELSSWGEGVNDHGAVVGHINGQGYPIPFLVDPVTGVRFLEPFGQGIGIAYGINNAGMVVGSASTGDETGPFQPFLLDGLGAVQLPLPPQFPEGGAFCISTGGRIGGSLFDGQSGRPGVWIEGAPQELPLPAGFTGGVVRSITDKGWAGGDCWVVPMDARTPVLWRDGQVILLPTLDGPYHEVIAINDAGVAVGTSYRSTFESEAVIWSNGHIETLESLVIGGVDGFLAGARGIDDQGRIIAYGIVNGILNCIVRLTPACYANCDGSTAEPVLNVQDFSCFLNAFASGDRFANCDNSSVAPVLNVQDFTCFLIAFAAGCP